jgi:hypothetical protein
MVRKAALSVLLLLLMGVQAFAADCDVRCDAMALKNAAVRNPAGKMSGMAHCHGMASRRASGHAAVATLRASQPCANHICSADWTFVQSAHEAGVSPLPMAQLRQDTISINVASSMHFGTGRSTHTLPPLDPLAISTSLRV